MDKRFVSILVALVIIFGGIFFFSQKSSDNSAHNAQPTNHVKGKGTTGVKLVEYGDYECPVCQAYSPVVDQVIALYGNKITFQFRNLALEAIHFNSRAGARAAEAAGLQGKYWQMHDALYKLSNWQVWSPNTVKNPLPFLEGYAQQIGLNLDQFKKDYASSSVNDAINADVAEFQKTGQQESTPSFFLNGQYIDNSRLTDANHIPLVSKFKAIIDAAIAKKSQ